MRGRNSAQWLADRTKELGYEVSRSVISDLENGRRRYVTTAELVILAAALNTSPVVLIYPGPYDIHVELAPGLRVIEFDAAQWFSGFDTHLFRVGEVIDVARPDMLEKFQQWQKWQENTEMLDQWRELKELIATRDNMDHPDHVAALNRQIRSVEDRLIRLLGRKLDSDAVDPPVNIKIEGGDDA